MEVVLNMFYILWLPLMLLFFCTTIASLFTLGKITFRVLADKSYAQATSRIIGMILLSSKGNPLFNAWEKAHIIWWLYFNRKATMTLDGNLSKGMTVREAFVRTKSAIAKK